MIGKGLSRNLKILFSSGLLWLGVGIVPPAAAQATLTIDPPTGTGIPPAGLDVTLTVGGVTGASVYYTTDGSIPSEGGGTSQLYSTAVHVAEQTGLVSTTTVVFKAKAFKDASEVASVSANYTNFAEAEFSIKFLLDGAADGQDVLELGFVTGATDGLDSHDVSTGAARGTRVDPGVPPLPVASARFITADHDFLVADYRSRTTPKLWPLYVQVGDGTVGGATSLTLKWGANAGVDFTLPDVPYLVLEVVTGGVTATYDLRQAGQVTFNQSYMVDTSDLTNSPCRIVYRNQGILTADISPAGAVSAGAQWAYRPASGGAFSSWQDTLAQVVVHPGDYEVTFKQLSDPPTQGYAPPNQIVTVTAEATTGDDPGELDAAYMTAPTEATMDVPPLYDPDTKTVAVSCTFTSSPDVPLTQVTWVFNLPADWNITAINGLSADWSYEIQADGRTVIFTYTGSRAAVSGSYFEFSADCKYEGAGDPGQLDVVVTSVSGTPSGGGDPVDTDPPASQSSNPRTANLDVDEDGLVYDANAFSYDFDDIQILYNYISWRANGLTDEQIVGSGLLTAGTESLGAGATPASILALVQELASGPMDVDGDGLVYDTNAFSYDFDDIQILYNYISWRANGLTDQQIVDSGLLTAGTESLGAGMTPALILQNVLNLMP